MVSDEVERTPRWPSAVVLGTVARVQALRAFNSMPDIFVGSAIVAVVLSITSQVLVGNLSFPFTADAHSAYMRKSPAIYLGIRFALSIANMFVSAYVAVAIHRFVLLEEIARGFSNIRKSYGLALEHEGREVGSPEAM